MFDNLNISDELKNLSEEERKYALDILGEISKKGSSKKFDDLRYADYEEIPVDIYTFLHDPNYLGKGLINEEGKYTVFPYWEKKLKEVFPDNITTRYNTFVLSGAIGLGKSFIAVLCILYQLYRMMCLKDPYIHYGLQPVDKITFAFMNITLDASKGVGWDKAQSLLQASPWFMSKGTVSGRDTLVWRPPKGIELIAGSQSRHIIGRAVFSAFFDEISFQLNQDVNKQIEKAKTLINTAQARMISRFMHGEYNPTLLLLASSKRTEQSFLETFIETKKKKESKTTLIVDEPQWVIRTDKDSPNKFYVAVGNKFLDSEVLPLNVSEADLDIYRNRGFTLLKVPMGYYEQFLDDIDIALTDCAGISTSNTTRYISGPRLVSVKNYNIKNPFSKDIIEVGNGLDDKTQYWDYFDLNQIDPTLKSRPMYIHLDMSISGDKTGIAGIWIVGKKPPAEGQQPSKELYYRLAFSVAIKAPKGHQISFEKNRQFIYWLREQGFNIKGVSTDTFQSADLGQSLTAHHFNYSVISVDRCQDRVCLPYQYLKSTIYEQRIEMYDSKLLTDELIGLERDGNGKIDHSPSGINCFTADTKISLTDGREIRIIDLIDEVNHGKKDYVYSFNEKTRRIEPKQVIKGWCSGKTAKVAVVTLDNGEIIECTPEHRFMLRDGNYCEAQHLIPNDSLMPLYRKYPSKGLCSYRMYYEPIENEWHFEHRQFANAVCDEKFLVHHIDCNPKNNNPDNLIWMSRQSHIDIHSTLQTGAQSPEAKAKRQASVKQWWDRNRNTDQAYLRVANRCNISIEEVKQSRIERKKQKQEKIDQINKVFNIDYESLDKASRTYYLRKYNNYLKGYDISDDKYTAMVEKRAAAAAYYDCDYDQLNEHERRSMSIKYARIADPTYQERVSRAVSENHKKGKYKNAATALEKCNQASHQAKLDRYHKSKKYQEILEMNELYGIDYESLPYNKKISYIHRYHNSKKKNIINHKIISVDIIDKEIEVYDITVKDNHNFALTAGVIVHNSKDTADALCGAIWNASQHAEEFAFDYGENLNQIFQTNSNQANLTQEQVVVDFETELKKAMDPRLKSHQQNKPADTAFMDFGLGAAQPVGSQFLSDGILIW